MGAERLLCCFKYEDAEVFLQRLDPCADVGLVDATRPWGTVETQTFGDGYCLDQRRREDAAAN